MPAGDPACMPAR